MRAKDRPIDTERQLAEDPTPASATHGARTALHLQALAKLG
jgi:hypothetical protein